MFNLKKSATILLILASVTMMHGQTPQDALSVITTYAEDGNSVPTVADYVDLGMIEIGTHNIDAINDKIATLPQTAIDTAEKIQKLIDTHNLMIHSVLNVVTGFILTSETMPTDVPTNFDIEYTIVSTRHGDAVKPTGTIDGVDEDIKTYQVNGENVHNVNARTFTFDGNTLFSGDTLTIEVVLESGKIEIFTK